MLGTVASVMTGVKRAWAGGASRPEFHVVVLVVHVERDVLDEALARIEPQPGPRRVEHQWAQRRHRAERERKPCAARGEVTQ